MTGPSSLRTAPGRGADRAPAPRAGPWPGPAGPEAEDHLEALARALDGLERELGRIGRWAAALAGVLAGGGRLLAVGNGAGAAQAQHLTSELVGRYCDDRPPFSAIALHAEPSALTAIANDYGVEAVYARQVRAHGRPGDVLVALSAAGDDMGLVGAARAAEEVGLTVWSLTGRRPNPLASCSADTLGVDAAGPATVQEAHLVAVHLLCAYFDDALEPREGT